MSLVKRRLDEAILAGKLIEQGVDLTRLHVECNRLTSVQSIGVGEVPSLETEEHRSVFSVRISSSGTQALVGLDNEEIQLYSLDGSRHDGGHLFNMPKMSEASAAILRKEQSRNDGPVRLRAILKVGRPEGQPLTSIRFVPKNENMALFASATGGVLCCNVTRHDQLAFSLYNEPQKTFTCIDCSSDGKRFAVAGNDATIRLVDVETGELLQRISSAKPNDPTQTSGAHTTRLFALKFVTDTGSSAVLFSGGWDQSVKMWDSRCPDPLVHSFFGVQVCGESIDCANGQLLVGSWRAKNTLQLWDVGTTRLIRSDTPTTYIYAAQFYDHGTQSALAAGSGRNELVYANLHRSAKTDVESGAADRGAADHNDALLGVISFEKPIYTLHGFTETRKILFGGASPNMQLLHAD